MDEKPPPPSKIQQQQQKIKAHSKIGQLKQELAVYLQCNTTSGDVITYACARTAHYSNTPLSLGLPGEYGGISSYTLGRLASDDTKHQEPY